MDDQDSGLTPGQDAALDEIIASIDGHIARICLLGWHRSLTHAVTRLDEAKHWLNDRRQRTP